MTLVFKNLQTAIKLNATRTRKDVDLLRHLVEAENFDLGFLCVDNNTMRFLNKRFRKMDKPTDILSFPFYPASISELMCLARVEGNLVHLSRKNLLLVSEEQELNCQPASMVISNATIWFPLRSNHYPNYTAPKMGLSPPGVLPKPESDDGLYLGDIYVGIPYLVEAHKERHMDVHDALVILATHGLCHLLGYTHDTEATWRRMFNKELQILHRYNQVTGRELKPFTGVDDANG